VVVDDARAMTLGTGEDVAVLILDPALAMALRTDFHAACPVPSRQHKIFETPVPHRQPRLPSAPPTKAIEFFEIPPERVCVSKLDNRDDRW
jgi:hypothetical protein